MRKLFILLLVAGLAVLTAIPAFAQTTEFTGTISHEDLFIDTVAGDLECSAANSLEFYSHYQVISYNAPVTGSYLYADFWYYEGTEEESARDSASGRFGGKAGRAAPPEGTVIDVVIQLYPEGGFDPSDPMANCIGAADDAGIFELAAGDYDIVVTTYWEDDAGVYYFEITAPEASAVPCPYPLPGGSVVYNIPAGAPAFYEASLETGTGFTIPAGTWYVSEFSGDFALVWVSCEGSPVWVPSNAVAH